MKSTSMPEKTAGGLDQRYFPDRNAAADIHNFRYSPDGGWRNDRGWEPLIEVSSPYVVTDADILDITAPCRFLSIWSRHSGSEEYYLQERNGILFYEFGNGSSNTVRRQVLASNRHLPRSDEPGTQLVPYGRFALLLNGHDGMLKWWGRTKVEPFGFTQLATAPYCLQVQVDYNTEDGYTDGDPINNELNGIAVQFSAGSYVGLGDPTMGSINFYSYRVSYISDTGSESPMSEPANSSWTLLTDSTAPGATQPERLAYAKANERKYGVMLTGLEPGPEGTVARVIYRTKNKKDGISGAGDNYYKLVQISDNTTRMFLDVIPDNELVSPAPSVNSSVPISSSYKLGAAWNGTMWLAGGDVLPTRVIYSTSGLPEQFAGTSYFDVGIREGGAITSLFPYYDVLLVFRERAIDAIFTGENGYTCTTIHQTIGTTATGSIVLVPGLGVMFLNSDGFFLISGGMRGGSSLTVTPMSGVLETEMARLSVNALCRATATYSNREKEYWCHYPVDGATENSHGASFNLVSQQWSLRGNTDGITPWPFAKLATDSSGWIIIGLNPIYNVAASLITPGWGLQVWSAYPAPGSVSLITTNAQQQKLITWTDAFPMNCIWQSTWDDYGDDSVKKRVLSVELDVLTEGDNPIELQWSSDYSVDWKSAGTVKPQIGDQVGSTKTDPTYGSGSNVGTWGATKWQPQKVTRLRWDVVTGLVSQFSFRIVTTNQVQIVRYQTNLVGSTVKTPNTRMPGAS